MATTIKKIITIGQIIRLKQVMKNWKARSIKHKLPLSDSGLAAVTAAAASFSPSHHILSGFFAVYVGEERKRFLIPTRFLNLPLFVHLLKVAEEEYGFKYCNGGIALPCEVEFFEGVLELLEKDEKMYGSLEVNELLKLICEMGFDSFSCKESPDLHHQSFMPLLLKTRV